MRAPRDQRGFTLIEVLVAFTMLAITLGVLMQSLSTGMGHQRVSSRYLAALTLAESELAAVTDAELTAGAALEGSAADRLRWRIDMQPLLPPAADSEIPEDAPLSMYQVRAVVSWPSWRGSRELTLTTIRVVRAETP